MYKIDFYVVLPDRDLHLTTEHPHLDVVVETAAWVMNASKGELCMEGWKDGKSMPVFKMFDLYEQ